MIEIQEMQSLLYNLQWLQQKDSFEKSDVVDVLGEIFDILLKMNKMQHIPSPYGAGSIVKENEEDPSKWYNCAHCDAGYPEQECTCKENEND